MKNTRNARYEALTIDGGVVLVADTMQQISDALIAHNEAGNRPRICNVYDNAPGIAFPYTVYRPCALGYVGTSYATYEEMFGSLGVA